MARQNTPSAALAAIFKDIPSADVATAGNVGQKLIAGGSALIQEIIALVGQKFGDPEGITPKYALHGAVLYAGRPGADKARKMVAGALAEQLAKDHSDDMKAFLIRQLQFCGQSAQVPALAKFLGDKTLCEPATQALLALGDKAATAAIRGAMGRAKGKHRVTLLNAVGRLKDKDSAGAARKLASDSDRDVRIAAFYALGNIGDAESAGVLLKAAVGKESYERTQAVDACLLLACSLAENGDTANAAKTCRGLSTDRSYDRCAALAVLARTCGPEATADVMKAMDCKDVKVRHPAAGTAVKLASTIAKSDSAQSEKLLKKAVESTTDGAVIYDARTLLAAIGK